MRGPAVPQLLAHLGDVDASDTTEGYVVTVQADGSYAHEAPTGGEGGTSDHGALSGLGDDDHTIYALTDGSRGDFEAQGAVAAHEAAGDPHPGYLTEAEANAAYAALAHTHEGGTSGPGVVIPPPVTVDEGPPFTVTTTYQWGITPSGDAYYNSAGVTTGDEALLVIDGTDHYLRPTNA